MSQEDRKVEEFDEDMLEDMRALGSVSAHCLDCSQPKPEISCSGLLFHKKCAVVDIFDSKIPGDDTCVICGEGGGNMTIAGKVTHDGCMSITLYEE